MFCLLYDSCFIWSVWSLCCIVKTGKKCRNSAKNTDSMITKLCYNFFLFFFETFIFSKYLVSPRYLIFILSSQVIFSDYLILSFQFLGVKYLILSFWTKKKDRKHWSIRVDLSIRVYLVMSQFEFIPVCEIGHWRAVGKQTWPKRSSAYMRHFTHPTFEDSAWYDKCSVSKFVITLT